MFLLLWNGEGKEEEDSVSTDLAWTHPGLLIEVLEVLVGYLWDLL